MENENNYNLNIMEGFMNFDVSFIYKIWSFLKTIFWKKENIIYINSNKKMQIKDNIDEYVFPSIPVVALSATTEKSYSPSSNIFLMCREILDLSTLNNNVMLV